ncbi:MAG: TolC family protein, partial [Pseudomonadota bacterium]
MTRMPGIALALITAAVVAGCAVGPDYHRPESRLPAQFTGVEATRYTPQASVAAFWTVFGDST